MSGAAARTGDLNKKDNKTIKKKQYSTYCKDNIQTVTTDLKLIM